MISKIWFVKNKDGGTFYYDTYEAAKYQVTSEQSEAKIYQTCLHCARLFAREDDK